MHLVIGVASWESDWASTAYAVVTLVAALVVVFRAPGPELVAAAVGYVAGAEVLWRMTDARIPWETGKYATAGLLLLALIRFWPGWRSAVLPALYLLLLVPGAVVAIDHFGLVDGREPLSFNLSGPFAIAITILFFSQLRTNMQVFRSLLWPVLFPIAAMATAVMVGALQAGAIRFVGESNLATSGGFGPNQVSAVLGFGVLVCCVLALTERNHVLLPLEIGLAAWFLTEAIFTFARGGLANLAVAGLLALITTLRRPGHVGRGVLVAGAVLVVICLVLFPLANSLTGGGLYDRYESLSFTQRDAIVRDDLESFREEPLLGAGAGVAQTRRPAAIEGEAAHTEYTRLLAEHGIFGAVALAVLLLMALLAFRRARRGAPRVLVAVFAGWSFAQMSHSATRIALVGFALGLAAAAAGISAGDAGSPEPTEPEDPDAPA